MITFVVVTSHSIISKEKIYIFYKEFLRYF